VLCWSSRTECGYVLGIRVAADLAPIKYYHASSWAAAGLLPLGLMIKVYPSPLVVCFCHHRADC
jgi:hypothetical protein